MREEWPLVGRREELGAIAAALADPERSGLVLVGPPGVGKTRLAAECAALAAKAGFSATTVAASRSAMGIPLGALAQVLPAAPDPAIERADVLIAATRAITARGEGKTVLLVIDDAQWLDETSAVLLHQVAVSRSAFIVATVRTGERVHEAITALWKDGLAARLDLDPLDEFRVGQLLRSVLGGPVDGATSRELAQVSEGNPLYIRELVLAGLESSTLAEADGVWRLKGAFPRSARLSELVAARLAELTGDERSAIEVVALGEPLGLGLLEALGYGDAVERLERRDLLHVRADGRRLQVSLAHPVHGEAVRSRLASLRSRVVSRKLADALEATGARRREDLLRLATWRLDGGGDVSPDLMSEAAGRAAGLFDFVLSERLARAAIAAGAGVSSECLLGDALARQGRTEEAEVVLDEAMGRATEEMDLAIMARLRAENLLWGLDRFDEALAVLADTEAHLRDPFWRDVVVATRASVEIRSGYPGRAVERVAYLLDHESPLLVILAAIVSSPGQMLMGRLDAALAVATRAYGLQQELGTGMLPFPPELHQVMATLALTNLGRLSEAEQLSRQGYDVAMSGRDDRSRAWFATMLGRIYVDMGDLTQAIDFCREAVPLFRTAGQFGMARLSFVTRVVALAATGDGEGAASVLEELGVLEDQAVQIFGAEVERARAWTAWARGAESQALRLFEGAADLAARTGEYLLEVIALHDLARLGNAAQVAPRLAGLVMSVEGPMAQARADHAAALAADDADGLVAVGESFAEMGARLLAAEAFAAAAASSRRAGQSRQVAAYARRARDLLGQCPGGRSLVPLDDDSHELSTREREVARLAAEGMSARLIAEQLYLSVRTVETHLQRTYGKLGIRDRSQLAQALGLTTG